MLIWLVITLLSFSVLLVNCGKSVNEKREKSKKKSRKHKEKKLKMPEEKMGEGESPDCQLPKRKTSLQKIPKLVPDAPMPTLDFEKTQMSHEALNKKQESNPKLEQNRLKEFETMTDPVPQMPQSPKDKSDKPKKDETDEDLFHCRDYTPETLKDVGHLYDLLTQ